MQNLLRALGDRRLALKDGKQSQKGFTLVELLVVVIIIGILAGIAIPVFLNQRESAWRAEVESDLKNAGLAAETYSVDHNGSYLGMTEDLLGTDYGFRTAITEANYITVEVVGEVFTVTANHPNLDDNLTYSSATGGLQAWP